MRKKKILFHSNHCKVFTGFGKNAKNILKYLYDTDNYEIVELSNGLKYSDPKLKYLPWKCYGGLPDSPEVHAEWSKDASRARIMNYGGATIDEVIREERPDIYIGAEDIWAFGDFYKRKWWSKLNCMIWTTLDSLPILPEAIAAAPQIKHYFVWATFAERALRKLGHKHVKTMRGSLDTTIFNPLPDSQKKHLRSRFNLDSNFIIGFVFRNQLRKSVPNLLDGFKSFAENNPLSQAKLLLHTHWSEGWDIPRLLEEKGINNEDVLTTYFCHKCNAYEIKPFKGQQQDCRFCGGAKTQITTNVDHGVMDSQLNEIYNLMDVYCHPFTSGGQEIPVQEAKLTELITLVTDYSCGEDCCTEESGGLPLNWTEYREPGTQFIKATTDPSHISQQLQAVYDMPFDEKRKVEKLSRQWVIDNFSVKAIGQQLEAELDKMPLIDWDFDFTEERRHPEYIPPPIEDDGAWIIDIYKNILNMDVTPNDQGFKDWSQALREGRKREDILNFFQETARKENLSKGEEVSAGLTALIDDKKEKRLVVVMPGSIGDVYMMTGLLPSLSEVYPEYAIYFATDPKYFDIIKGNPHVYKAIPYHPKFDDLLFLEGHGSHAGFFDIAFLPNVGTQRIFNYQHNAQDKIQFDLCTS